VRYAGGPRSAPERASAAYDGCFPDDILDDILNDCIDTWLECGGEVAILDSCPIQFACGE
jgi:hypothetical protein